MKRACILSVIAGILFLFTSSSYAAQQEPNNVQQEQTDSQQEQTSVQQESISEVHLFKWASGDSPDWTRGIFYALVGLIGALITVFSLIGGAIPGTAGYMRIEAGMKRVEERERALDILIKNPTKNAEQIKAVEIATNNLRDDIRENRRRQFALAASLYAILGAFSAMLLAQDLLQALVIGAGWTAFVGAMGLKKDYAERKAVKDQTTEALEKALSEKDKEGKLTIADSELVELRMDANVSKAI